MNILAIVGSPRKGGNTDDVMDRFIEGAKSKGAEVEKVYLRDLDISFCQGAFTCEVAGNCIIPDDMGRLTAKMQKADGIVLGAPVYVGQVPGFVVNFLDRCRPFLSYVDALTEPELSPEEEKAMREEKTCLALWKGERSYAEMESMAEQLMDNRTRAYYAKHGSHPGHAKRLKKGKKGAIILVYGQHVENRYPDIVGFLELVMGEYWAMDLLETISVDSVVKKGDARQYKADLLERAFKTGQEMAAEK